VNLRARTGILSESGDVSWLAFRTNGQERESVERHPAEKDHDPRQSPYAPKKELTGGQQELERLAANVRWFSAR
jgi:hypothetical protein